MGNLVLSASPAIKPCMLTTYRALHFIGRTICRRKHHIIELRHETLSHSNIFYCKDKFDMDTQNDKAPKRLLRGFLCLG